MLNIFVNEIGFIFKRIYIFLFLTIVFIVLTIDSGMSFFIKGIYKNADYIVSGVLTPTEEWVRRAASSHFFILLISIVIIYILLSKIEDLDSFLFIIPDKTIQLIIARVVSVSLACWSSYLVALLTGNFILRYVYNIMHINLLLITVYAIFEGFVALLPYIAFYIMTFYIVKLFSDEKKYLLYYPVCFFVWFLSSMPQITFYKPLNIRDIFFNPLNWFKIGIILLLTTVFIALIVLSYSRLKIGKGINIFKGKDEMGKYKKVDGGLKSSFYYEFKASYGYKGLGIILIPLAFITIFYTIYLTGDGGIGLYKMRIMIVSELLFPVIVLPYMKNLRSDSYKIREMFGIIPRVEIKQLRLRGLVYLLILFSAIATYVLVNILLFQFDIYNIISVIIILIPNCFLLTTITFFLLNISKKAYLAIAFSGVFWFLLFGLRKVLPYYINPFAFFAYSINSGKFLPSKIYILIFSIILSFITLLKYRGKVEL